MTRSVIHEKLLNEEKYIVPEIVDLLNEVNLLPTVTSSKNFSVQLVR